jgi:hypothetical protein
MTMPRETIALTIPDLSDFARALRARLEGEPALPGHQALLGHLAAAAGFRNWQHLRAALGPAPAPAPPPDPAALRRLERAAHVWDAAGRMKHWPGQTALQGLCLWVFWARMPAGVEMTEPEVNALLRAGHLFGDHVLLRRSLIDHRLVRRSPDCRSYARIEQPPPPEALALIRRLSATT